MEKIKSEKEKERMKNALDSSTKTCDTICAFPLAIDQIRVGAQLKPQEHSLMKEEEKIMLLIEATLNFICKLHTLFL